MTALSFQNLTDKNISWFIFFYLTFFLICTIVQTNKVSLPESVYAIRHQGCECRQQESKIILDTFHRFINVTAAVTLTRPRVAGGWQLLLFGPGGVAFPGQAGVLGAVPDALDPRPGLAAWRRAGEGRAVGRGVHEDVTEQQAVEAAEHVHHTERKQRREDVSGGREGRDSEGKMRGFLPRNPPQLGPSVHSEPEKLSPSALALLWASTRLTGLLNPLRALCSCADGPDRTDPPAECVCVLMQGHFWTSFSTGLCSAAGISARGCVCVSALGRVDG